MSRLTYNHSIFTNVHKWDEDYAYLGILVTGKLNQRNGEDYPILDVIDLDWDGAYLKNLSTYLYTTEDLINVLDIFGDDHNYLRGDVINNSYLSYVIQNMQKDYAYQITKNNMTIQEDIFNNLVNQYEVLDQIREVVLDDTRYLKLEHDEVFDENNDLLYPTQEYYIYYDRMYWKVNNDYVKAHPEETYYQFILRDILRLNREVIDIYSIIGTEEKDPFTQQVSYTGFYERFHDINENINDLSYLTSYSIDLGSIAYTTSYENRQEIENIKPIAYMAYANSYLNTEKIGHHTLYNIYEQINEYTPETLEYIQKNGNTVFTYNPNTQEYIQVAYNPNYKGQYYLYYSSIEATGIEKEIEDITRDISDNTYVLYKLHTKSNDPENIQLTITPNDLSSKERTINVDITKMRVDRQSGTNTVGIVTYTGLTDSLSYMFSWKNLK